MTIAMVCFDLGGVLIRTCHTWEEGCLAADLEHRVEANLDRVQAAHRRWTDELGLGRISEAEWAERIASACDGLYSPSEIVRIHYAWTQREYDGVGAIIDALHTAGIETSCLSNTNHAHWTRIIHHDGVRELPGLPEYPTVRRLGCHFASHLLAMAKPDPAIYEAFERATGTSGSSILFFDDRAENVAAARSRGWRAEPIDAQSETAAQITRLLIEHGVLSPGETGGLTR
jgi:FMN phosphatase YigB (HAD superfamily)